MNVKNNLVYGDIFLIPNAATQFGEMYNVARCKDRVEAQAKSLGINLKNEDLLVQVWITDPEPEEGKTRESQNWLRHDKPSAGIDRREVMEWWPASLFLGKRDGDKIIVPLGTAICELTISQNKYRYNSLSFEDTLKDVFYLHEHPEEICRRMGLTK
jgi:hypothetical protein